MHSRIGQASLTGFWSISKIVKAGLVALFLFTVPMVSANAEQEYVMRKPMTNDDIGFCRTLSDAKNLLKQKPGTDAFVEFFSSLRNKNRCIYGLGVNHTPWRIVLVRGNTSIMKIKYHANGHFYYALIYNKQISSEE